jgi:hypothetical protein
MAHGRVRRKGCAASGWFSGANDAQAPGDGRSPSRLDRTGAPHLDVSWTASAGHVNLVIAQTQAEGVYTLDLDVLIEDTAGVQRMHAVHLDQRRQEFQLPFAGNASTVAVDPVFKILRWDEVYRRRGG